MSEVLQINFGDDLRLAGPVQAQPPELIGRWLCTGARAHKKGGNTSICATYKLVEIVDTLGNEVEGDVTGYERDYYMPVPRGKDKRTDAFFEGKIAQAVCAAYPADKVEAVKDALKKKGGVTLGPKGTFGGKTINAHWAPRDPDVEDDDAHFQPLTAEEVEQVKAGKLKLVKPAPRKKRKGSAGTGADDTDDLLAGGGTGGSKGGGADLGDLLDDDDDLGGGSTGAETGGGVDDDDDDLV